MVASHSPVAMNPETLKRELHELAQGNLDEATFDEKRDIINAYLSASQHSEGQHVRCKLGVVLDDFIANNSMY
jgi:hypothetical protein